MKWKYIEGYSNYIISDEGVVVSLNWNGTKQPKQVKPWKQKTKGYLLVNLWNGKTQNKILLHRLVAKTFLGEGKGKVVDHINFDVEDNRVSNLRYLTLTESNRYRRHGKDRNITKHRRKWVVTIKRGDDTHRQSFARYEDAVKHRDEMLPLLHGHNYIAMR